MQRFKAWVKGLSTTAAVLGILVSVGTLGGMAWAAKKALDAYVWVPRHEYNVLASVVQKDVERLEKKMVRDEINWRRQKCAGWIGKYGSVAQMPPEVRTEYERLKGEIADYQKQLGGK